MVKAMQLERDGNIFCGKYKNINFRFPMHSLVQLWIFEQLEYKTRKIFGECVLYQQEATEIKELPLAKIRV
jgi:hypothetical protein